MDVRAVLRTLTEKHGGDARAARAELDAILEDRRARAAAQDIEAVAEKLAITKPLKRSGGELVGPCPVCGGRDRFAINGRKGVFNCRVCGANGGAVKLVGHVMGCDYGAAVDWLLGEIDLGVSADELDRRRVEAERAAERRAREAARFRARAERSARKTWKSAVPATNTAAHSYLAGRGISREALAVLPPTLRYLPDHRYIKALGGAPVEMHRGPAMIAAVQDARGRVRAVHQTWIDPVRRGEKARITRDGADQPAKLVRGLKKGGAIRLSSARGCDTLVMGEGIETTLSALVADAIPAAAYWAGVDLGNISGHMLRVPGVKWSGQPDMEDSEAFVPPAWVRRFVLIMDGDSSPTATRARLESGARRAMALRPGLVAEVVVLPRGKDLNDVLREGAT